MQTKGSHVASAMATAPDAELGCAEVLSPNAQIVHITCASSTSGQMDSGNYVSIAIIKTTPMMLIARTTTIRLMAPRNSKGKTALRTTKSIRNNLISSQRRRNIGEEKRGDPQR